MDLDHRGQPTAYDAASYRSQTDEIAAQAEAQDAADAQPSTEAAENARAWRAAGSPTGAAGVAWAKRRMAGAAQEARAAK